MEAPDQGHQYHNIDEISPDDLNDWWREVMSQVPMVGYIRGGTVRCYPGSTDVIIAPYAYCLGGADGPFVGVVNANTVMNGSALVASTTYHVYVHAISSGTIVTSFSTTAPTLDRLFMTGDDTERYLATFTTDGAGAPIAFSTDATALTEGMWGYLRGGNLRSAGGVLHVDPHVLTMPVNDNRGLITITQRFVLNHTPADPNPSGGLVADTRYYCYINTASFIVVSTVAPDASKIFSSATQTQRYVGTFLTDASGGIPAFTDAPVHSSVLLGRVFGGDLRSSGNDIVVRPFSLAVLTSGVIEHVSVTDETAVSPSLATDTWYYAFCSIADGVPTIAASTTPPAADLIYKTGDVTSIYLGCFRTDNSGNILPFRKIGHEYFYLRSKITGTYLSVLTGGTVQNAWTDVACGKQVPPHASLATLEIEFNAHNDSGNQANVRTNGDTAGISATLRDPTVGTGIDGNTSVTLHAQIEVDATAGDTGRIVEYRIVRASATPFLNLVVLGFKE